MVHIAITVCVSIAIVLIVFGIAWYVRRKKAAMINILPRAQPEYELPRAPNPRRNLEHLEREGDNPATGKDLRGT
jgi:hypothetical protein